MKAIETEYKKQICLEIPDLWSRIEAGVDEYERTKPAEVIMTEEKTEKTAEVNIDTKEEKVTSINRKKTIIMIGKIAGAAACMMLAVTVLFNFGSRKSDNATATSEAPAAAEYVYSDEAPCASTEESVAMEEACEESAYDDTNYSYISGANGVDATESSSITEADSSEIASDVENKEAVLEDISDEVKILVTELDCTDEEAVDIIEILRRYEVGKIKTAEYRDTESLLGHDLYDYTVYDNVKLLWMTDSNDKQYILFTEYFDGKLVLKMIREEDFEGEILYQD